MLSDGVVIKEYPDDTPYPSKLLLGFRASRPLHVVFTELADMIIVISAYEPDAESWGSDYKRRKV